MFPSVYTSLTAAFKQLHADADDTKMYNDLKVFKCFVIGNIHEDLCSALGKDETWSTCESMHSALAKVARKLTREGFMDTPGPFGVSVLTNYCCGKRSKTNQNPLYGRELSISREGETKLLHQFATNMDSEERKKNIPVPHGKTVQFIRYVEGHDLVMSTIDAILAVVLETFVCYREPDARPDAAPMKGWRGDLSEAPWRHTLNYGFPLLSPTASQCWNKDHDLIVTTEIARVAGRSEA